MKKLSVILIVFGLLMVVFCLWMPQFTSDEASLGVWKIYLFLGVVMTVIGTVYLWLGKK